MYEVYLERAAERDLRRLSAQSFHRVVPRIRALAENPRPPGCRKLAGSQDDWRIRIGDCRLVYQIDEGLLVTQMVRGGAAERAGIRGPQVRRVQRRQGPYVFEQTVLDRAAADLIVGIDGKRIRTFEEFIREVESRQPGEEVTLSVIRDGGQRSIQVTLDADES